MDSTLAAAHDGEHEILHLEITVKIEENIWTREYAFMSDHTVYTRVFCNGGTHGWSRVQKLWENRDALAAIAQAQAKKGWQVTWNPAYDPGIAEYRKEVRL